MASKALITVLVAGMLVTGVCNTLLTKYQDMQCIRNCDDPKTRENFEQPVIQTMQMFTGQCGSWLVVLGTWIYKTYISKKDAPLLYQPIQNGGDDAESDEDDDNTLSSSARTLTANIKPPAPERRHVYFEDSILFAIPACCDIAGTTLMNIGLLLVAASIYQMTRGALILFVGILSVIFLHRKVYLHQWFAMFIAVIGVGIVGLAGALFPGDKNSPVSNDGLDGSMELAKHAIRAIQEMANDVKTTEASEEVVNTIIGVLLIAFAQVFTASQFCIEEWLLERYSIEPLKVVGLEGLFGLTVTGIAQLVLHFAWGRSEAGQHGYFDADDGYRQVFSNSTIAISSVLIMISIGGFNFFGLSVTRSISATSRSIIDTCRTLFIWIISLALGWESFKWLQVVGFAMLVYGTFLFNDLIRPPLKACLPRPEQTQRAEPLLPEEPIEHI